jgi:glutaredoxin
MYKIYSKDGCVHCERAKELLEYRDIPYKEIKLGVDVDIDTFKEDNPSVRSMPYILFDEEVIGGYNELSKRLLG